MIKNKFKHNYVYEITYENNMKYIGVRSCNCNIEDDDYMGSSKIIPFNLKGTKTIIKTFETREEAVRFEREYQLKFNAHISNKYYNQVIQTSTLFDQSGCTKETHNHVLSMANKLKGRTKENCEYIRLANIKRKEKSGSNRTQKQIDGSKRQAESIRGIKNPLKGHPGTSSTSFVKWYYIDNNGTKHIINNVSKKDYAEKLGISYRQLVYRFSKKNEHNKMISDINSPIYGFIFGNLEEVKQTKSIRLKY